MRFLLDTTVLVEPSRPQPDAGAVAWLEARPALELAISVLTLGEIAKGLHLLPTGPKRERLAEWLAAELPQQFTGRMLAVDERVSREWGRLTAEGRQAGRDLPVIDGLLLATAAAHGLTFVTRNERDCAGHGIPVLNPWRPIIG